MEGSVSSGTKGVSETEEVMEEKNTLVIMDFSGVYPEQRFYEGEDPLWREVRELPGINCYCDEEAHASLREMIRELPAGGIHFIDSGNYHYMSRIWLEKLQEPFRLLVFDHHTDMQPPAFGGLLSCGGWIAAALEELPLLKEVILIGPGEKEFREDVSFLGAAGGSVHLFSRERLENASAGEELLSAMKGLDGDLPLYLSIDKDILRQEDASTAWSQGTMKLEELLSCLKALRERGEAGTLRILGADVCGECAGRGPGWAEGMDRNDRANRAILKELKGWKEPPGSEPLWEPPRKSPRKL